MKKSVAFIMTLVMALIVFTAAAAAVNTITLEGDHTVTAGQTITLSVKITNSSGTAIHGIQSATPVISGASLDIGELPGYMNRDTTTGFLWADLTRYVDGETFMYLNVTPDGSVPSLRINNSVLNLQAFDDTTASVLLEDTVFVITVIPGGGSSAPPSSGGGGGYAAPQPAGTAVSTAAVPETPLPETVTTAVPRDSAAPSATATATAAPESPAPLAGLICGLGAAAVLLRRR